MANIMYHQISQVGYVHDLAGAIMKPFNFQNYHFSSLHHRSSYIWGQLKYDGGSFGCSGSYSLHSYETKCNFKLRRGASPPIPQSHRPLFLEHQLSTRVLKPLHLILPSEHHFPISLKNPMRTTPTIPFISNPYLFIHLRNRLHFPCDNLL